MVIANPESGNGWARIETYLPWQKAQELPSFVIY
jgi:hypothetical protein